MGIIRSKYYGIIRGVTVGIAFLLQIVTMVLLSLYLIKGFFVVYLLLEVISVITVFALVNNAESYKLSWILIILLLPVSGLFLYFMWGRKRKNAKDYRIFRETEEDTAKYLVQNEEVAILVNNIQTRYRLADIFVKRVFQSIITHR